MKGLPGLTHKRSGVWAAVWVAALVGVRAQQPAAAPARAALPDGPLQRLSLADAQLIAFEKNWDLLAAAAGVDAATAQKIVAHEFPNPTLSLYSSLINVDNDPSGTTEGNGVWDRSYDTIFAINQLFEIGGKRRNRKASAQAGFEGAKAQLFDARRTLDVAVAKAYVAAAQAEENVRVLLQSAGTLREEARIAEVRLRAGEISSADKSQIEITAEQFELNAQSAKSASAQARVALEVLLGVPHPNAECVLTDHLETLCAATTPINTNSVGTWRPDVMAAEAALRKAEADLRFQKAVRIPDPTLQAQYEHQPPDNIGFIALFGQAVLNGVVMVSYFNQLQEEGLGPRAAVLQGAATRLRTVMMTALLAMLGLLPMALSHGIGSETQRPLAIVIIGGLVSATALTLMVLPTLYLVIERRANQPRVPDPS